MKLLDLFCGAGGAAAGYQAAGFDVVGVDLEPQPEYPGEFHQGDALEWAAEYDLAVFDAIHASPPCQGYTPMSNRWGSKQPRVIRQVVRYLDRYPEQPWVLENVRGSGLGELGYVIELTGEQFGLPVHRPRKFLTRWLCLAPPPVPRQPDPIAVYGKPDGRRLWTRTDGTVHRAWNSAAEGAAALGITHITDWHGIREAIPPAYTEYIGRQLRTAVENGEDPRLPR